MKLTQPLINTFKRHNINYEMLLQQDRQIARNRFSGEEVETTALIAYLIRWVYRTSDEYEQGIQETTISDFDRIRYFVMAEDIDAYMTTLD